ncbi:MAG TPA: phenylacetic acid degradation protein [Rhodobacteraceae bacterium]|jgi:ring-1,2-phenylacetyl-CoA epoxidase subunit PaaE|nr:2Fe-2S iron-sulfur cluster binding domain-containing protein [Paracoccaceae bacterium]HBG97346.1 phenylacetic acid degradation protein [Paracoccaceae bacterium]
MARFYDLTVTDIRKTIRDAVAVTLATRPEDAAAFAFTQGQYLTFRRDFDGQELRRSYSICSGLDDGLLQVGIKRVDGGAFSTWANEELRPGEVLQAMPPQGRFHTPLDPTAARAYLAFAGGSGITPVLSIVKTVLAREPRAEVTLVYANRALSSIMFREELEDLKNLHMGRLTILHILEEGAEDMELFTGRVDARKCAALFDGWIDVGAADTAFICGPEPMMLAISAALRDHGMAEDRIKYELFASAQPGQLPRNAAAREVARQGGRAAARITLDGAVHGVTLAAGQTILDAALGADLDAPYACKAGVCSTCRARIVEGEVEMAANHALEDYEVAQGYALTCQARPVTPHIVVDYDG